MARVYLNTLAPVQCEVPTGSGIPILPAVVLIREARERSKIATRVNVTFDESHGELIEEQTKDIGPNYSA